MAHAPKPQNSGGRATRCEFKARLVYKVRSRTESRQGYYTENPVSKNNTQIDGIIWSKFMFAKFLTGPENTDTVI